MIPISDCMKCKVISIRQDATLREAVSIVVENKVGTLPVIDAGGKLVGVVKLRDLLSLVMPNFINFIDHFEFVHSFGALDLRKPSKAELNRKVSEIMEEPVYAEETFSLMHAAAILHKNGLKDLPVINKEGDLIGLASHVDIGTALMRSWLIVNGDSAEKK